MSKIAGTSKIAKSVRLYAHNRKAFRKDQVRDVLLLTSDYQENAAIVCENADLFKILFGKLFDNNNRDWALFERMINLTINILRPIDVISCMDISTRDKAMSIVSQVLDMNNAESFRAKNKVDFGKFAEIMERMAELEGALLEKFANDSLQWYDEPNWISAMQEKTERWLGGMDCLRDYCAYLNKKKELDDEGMQAVYDVLESGLATESQIEAVFIKNVSKCCASSVIESVVELRNFQGNLFSYKIEEFKNMCDQYQTLTRQELAARLSARIPAMGVGAELAGSSEMRTLQRAIRSGGK